MRRFCHFARQLATIFLTLPASLSIIVLLREWLAMMTCLACDKPTKRFGKDRKGNQRYRCLTCGKTFTEPKIKMLDNMILAEGKALAVLSHLVEGCSIRSTERLTGVHRDTILDLLTLAGRKCEALSEAMIKDVPVQDVECDELWAYVGM